MTSAAAAPDDHRLATSLAEEAGRLLLDLRAASAELHPTLLRDEGDRQAHRLLADRLHEERPDDGLLSEEGVDTARRLGRERVWVVDPLDGTINFAHGFPFWAVSIALEHEGRLVVGVVHDPLAGATYSAAMGRGAQINGKAARVSAADRLRDSLIATALPVDLQGDVERQMSLFRRFSPGTHSVRRTGSSALNLALVAAGGLDVCYATFMNPWDAAAGVVLVREAGGLVTNLDGDTYDVYGEEILATNGRVHEESLRWIEECHPGGASATLTG